MREIYELYEKVLDELCEQGQKELTKDSLQLIDTLAHAGKNLAKIIECEEGGGNSYSYHYYDEDPRNTAMGSYRRSYRMSHKRDSMDRYSREGSGGDMGGNSNAGGNMSNRGGGYSRGGNNVTDGLRELMYAAPPEMQGEINRLIKKLDNM